MIGRMALSESELAELAQAKRLLEHPGIAARLAAIAGSPLEKGMKLLPSGWRDKVNDATRVSGVIYAVGGSTATSATNNNDRAVLWTSTGGLTAIPDFVTALQKKPDLAPARANLRLAMSMQGEYERAINGTAAADQAAALMSVRLCEDMVASPGR